MTLRSLALLAPALALAAVTHAQNQGGGVTAEAWITYDGGTLGTGWRFPIVP